MRTIAALARFLIALLFVGTTLSMGFTIPTQAQSGAEKTAASSSARISYQGRLTDGNGNPVADGNHTLVFKLYNQESGGSALWQETQNLETSNGVFSVRLGSVNSLSGLSFDQTLYLGIEVDGSEELTPRTRLTGAPYAYQARAIGDSTVTASAIKTGAVSLDKLSQDGASSGEVIQWDGSGWSAGSVSGSSSGSSWSMSGNSGTNPPSEYLGTSDEKALVVKVNGERAFRLAPDDTTVSITGGHPANSIEAGVSGSVIAGGGMANDVHTITKSYAAIGGGLDNTASGTEASVSGGRHNTASGRAATVGGGAFNAASGTQATVAGGTENRASDWNAAVGGGGENVASGTMSVIPGGRGNEARGWYSFAAGRNAKAGHSGSFVWGDSREDSVFSSGEDQFIVGAQGGIGLVNVNDPDAPVHIGSQNHWDLSNSEGDFKIGGDQYRMKVGVSQGGAGAGTVRIWAHGGTGQIKLGSNGSNVAIVQKDDGFYPQSDDTYNLGTSSNRWSAVYAANGTIQTSDRRLKTGIDSLGYGLAELLRLEPVIYRWKDEARRESDSADQHLGLIAQQVQKVVGEVVSEPESEDGYLGINYSELVPVLVRGIQEQQAQIQERTRTIEQQQVTIERQQDRLDSLRTQVQARHREQEAQISALKKQVEQLAKEVQEDEGRSAQPVTTAAAQ